METIFGIVVLSTLCGLLILVAYLKTELNIVENKIDDLEFLYDLRK